MTRNSFERHPRWSRYVGTLFAGGHSMMVLAIAALVGLLGGRLTLHAHLLEIAGAWISLTILALVAVLNILQLRTNGDITGSYRTRMLSAALRSNTHVLIALPVALTSGAGLLGFLAVGLSFCAGIVCTDTLDSVLVHRFLSRSPAAMMRAKRLWLTAVTAFALVVAAYQGAHLFGWIPPFNEIALSEFLMLALIAVYVNIMTQAEMESGRRV